MASKNNPISRQSDIVVQELKGEVLIYDLQKHKAFCLNETSALVWQLCDGNNSVLDISQKLSKKLKIPVTEDLIWLALNELKKDNLLSNSEEITTKFEGLSRREVIRKVGFASMIALPVISSLIAPTAAMAASGGLSSGTPRGNTTTCCGNTCDPAFDANRDAACNTTYGAACSSGAEETPGTCGPFNAGTGAVFSCRCI